MRFDELWLKAYGHFTDKKLDFKDGNQGLHLILGDNEAGKSTALRAIRVLLYGFPHQCKDNFLHDSKDLRVSGKLRNNNADSLFFTRRKSNTNDLLDEKGNLLDPLAFSDYLRHTQKELFCGLFSFSHEELKEGGRQILENKGAVGESLFAAGLGSSNLKQLMDELEKEAEEIFKPRGSKQKINQAIAHYERLKKEKEGAEFTAKEWEEKKGELKGLQADKLKIETELQQKSTKIEKLQRIERAMKWIPELEHLREQLVPFQDLPKLHPDFPQKRRSLIEKWNRDREQLRELENEKNLLQEEAGSLRIPETLLQRKTHVESLLKRLGVHELAVPDKKKAEADHQNLMQRALFLLDSKLPYSNDFAEPIRYKLSTEDKLAVQELGSELSALQTKVLDQSANLEKAQSQLKGIEQELEATESPRDLTRLAGAVRRAEQEGLIEEQARKLGLEIEQIETETQIQLKRLWGWQGTLEELERLAVPPKETIAQFERDFESIEREIDFAEQESERIKLSLHSTEKKLRSFERTGEIPQESELKRIRQERNEVWEIIKNDKVKPDQAQLVLFETLFHKADVLVDQLRFEAERIAHYTKLREERAELDEQIRGRQERTNQLLMKKSALMDRWEELWTDFSTPTMTPKEVLGWLTQKEEVLRFLDQTRHLRAALTDLNGKIGASKSELSDLTFEATRKKPNPATTLSGILDDAQRLLELNIANKNKKDSLEQRCLAAKLEAEELKRSLAGTDKKLASVRSDWNRSMKRLGLPEDADPKLANEVLGHLDEFFSLQHEMEGLSYRIDQMEKYEANLARDAATEFKQSAPDLLEKPFGPAITELNQRLRKAESDKEVLAEKKHRIHELEHKIRQLKIEDETSRKRHESLAQELGCKPSEIEQTERLCMEKEALLARIRELEQLLAENAGNKGLEEFIHDCRMEDVDALSTTIQSLDEQRRQILEQKTRIDQSIGGIGEALERMGSMDPAAVKEQELQSVGAKISQLTERYRKVFLANAILRRQIENYRKEFQSPLLQKATNYFNQMTLGSFDSLVTEADEKGQPVFKGIRPDKTELGVEEMSAGTLDQLYFSLRLASLAVYLEKNEPMPLVLDDVLVNFDDQRSKVALEILTSFSKKTQVLFFTHHEHLLNLASDLEQNPGVLVHRL